MSPPAVAAPILGSAGKEYKRESPLARLLGSDMSDEVFATYES